jgi:hypothetical protein
MMSVSDIIRHSMVVFAESTINPCPFCRSLPKPSVKHSGVVYYPYLECQCGVTIKGESTRTVDFAYSTTDIPHEGDYTTVLYKDNAMIEQIKKCITELITLWNGAKR